MGKFIDMTGWIMAEHGVPNSRLVVISRADNYVSPKTSNQSARFLCECSCQEHNRIIAVGSDIRRGHTLSCGCLDREITAAINKNKRNGNINGFCDDINYKWLLLTNSNEKTYYDAEDAWNSKQFEDFRDHFRNSCKGCSRRCECRGGCPIRRQIVLCNREEKNLYESAERFCD